MTYQTFAFFGAKIQIVFEVVFGRENSNNLKNTLIHFAEADFRYFFGANIQIVLEIVFGTKIQII